MPDNRPPHLWIPPDRIRVTPARTGRGGESFVRENPGEHSARLLSTFRASLQQFADKEDLDLATDLIVEITTASGRGVSAERGHLRNLGFQIIAYSAEDSSRAIARIPRDLVPNLTRKLETYAGTPKHRGKGNFGAIEALAPVGAERKIAIAMPALTDPPKPALISLYTSLPSRIKEQAAERLRARLTEDGKPHVAVHHFANGGVAVAASLTATDIAAVSEQYMFVRSIESNATIMIEGGIRADPIPQIIHVDRVRCETPVVVVDSGINAQASLLAGLVRRTFVELPPGTTGPHLSHGTFVASRAIYGDAITEVLARRAVPWCPVVDLQVTGVDPVGNRVTPSPAALAEILERLVPQLAREARVFNISLGVEPARTGFYSILARQLDFLSREHKVLFVVAAGNILQPVATPPMHFIPDNTRLLSPAEGLLVLSVGAIAKYHETGCVAEQQEVAPYSRRGPGADEGLKPELVAHGGNAMFDGAGWVLSPRTSAYGLGREGTHLEYAIGTSYSAPLVAQYAARLFDAYPAATPNLVKSLLCHFANKVLVPQPGAPVEDHHFCGFGEPDVERTLYSSDHSLTYLYQGSILADQYTYLPFHIPQALVDDVQSRLTVRGTIIFDPPVSSDDSDKYSLCRVAGRLRKRVGAGLQEVSIGGEETDVLYPWNPLLHFSHSFRRGYASGEWELRLRLMTRGDLPSDFSQSLAVVLEVIDRADCVRVRDAALQEFPGLYSPVVLRVAA